MTGKLTGFSLNRDGTQNITVTVGVDFSKEFDALKDNPVNIEIKKASKKRSLNANAFCWVLCSMIGQSMTPPLSDLEVYRKAIKAAGVHWITPVNKFKLEDVRRYWESMGDGWLFEILDDDEPGSKLCALYFGSSTYTVEAMQKLLDWLKDQCEQMGLTIPLSAEEERKLLERWGNNNVANHIGY